VSTACGPSSSLIWVGIVSKASTSFAYPDSKKISGFLVSRKPGKKSPLLTIIPIIGIILMEVKMATKKGKKVASKKYI
jgi:hypothetical protein